MAARRASRAQSDVNQQLRVVCVGEELDFTHALGNFARASISPQGRDATVDQRRTDGTLFDREQVVRGHLEVSGGERGVGLHLQARTVAVVPRRRRMNLDVERQFQLGDATQALAQDFFLDLELVLVGRVLVVASAAAGEVRAGRQDAVRRRLDDRVGLRPREARLLLGEGGLDFFIGQDEGDEHGLAASASLIIRQTVRRVGGQTCQAVAAVDQLFDCEEQGSPVRSNLQVVSSSLRVGFFPVHLLSLTCTISGLKSGDLSNEIFRW